MPSEKLASDDDISGCAASDEYPKSEGNTPIVSEIVVRRIKFKSRFVLIPALLMTIVPGMFGQASTGQNGAASQAASTEAKLPVFDVISIKPNKSSGDMVRIMGRPDSFSATNVSLGMLLQNAYGIRGDLTSGMPAWGDSARFDIEAKLDGADAAAITHSNPDQSRHMLQDMLTDRFKLKVHKETKQLPVYELVLAKGGSKLKSATPGDTYANGIKGPDGSTGHAGMMHMGRGEIIGQGIALSALTNRLAEQLQRTIVDKTGLTGKYDISLKWTPEEGPDPLPDSSTPSLFTALQEQLGLKLQSSKGPVETLVVDHVEMPSEN